MKTLKRCTSLVLSTVLAFCSVAFPALATEKPQKPAVVHMVPLRDKFTINLDAEITPEDVLAVIDDTVVSDEVIIEEIVMEEETIGEEGNEENYIPEFKYDNEYLLAKVVLAEAGNQGDLGLRLVIDVILNRVDFYSSTVWDVIYAPGQFDCLNYDYINHCVVTDYILTLIHEEAVNRTNSQVFYFRTEHFHNFGTPIIHERDHYFSGR